MRERKRPSENEREISAWMQELAALPVEESTVPDPAQLWWKAELLRRWDAQRRTAAAIDVGEKIEVAMGLAGAVALLYWLSRASLPGVLTAAVILGILTLLGFATLTVRDLFAREK